jgi:hypothetical protein
MHSVICLFFIQCLLKESSSIAAKVKIAEPIVAMRRQLICSFVYTAVTIDTRKKPLYTTRKRFGDQQAEF